MVPRRNMKAYVFLTILVTTSAFSVSYVPQAKGRKLFGGYRIVPKVCQPTHPSRIVSNEPAVCMFNHECTRRSGEVVGACMDGFLFGACCQLPAERPADELYETGPSTAGLQNIYEIDHVPDIPILLNPDGTPMGIVPSQAASQGQNSQPTVVDGSDIRRPDIPTLSEVLGAGGNMNVKISTFGPPSSTFHHASSTQDKTQIPQVDVSHLESDFSALLHQQSNLDDLRLPGLITHSASNNNIQDNQDPEDVDTVTTFLNPDQVLQIADPVDQLPVLFSQGIGNNNHSSPDTILLNENGSLFTENYNPDDLFIPGSISLSRPNGGTDQSNIHRPNTQELSDIMKQKVEEVTQKVEALTQKIAAEMESSLTPSIAHGISTNKVPTVTERPNNAQQMSSVTYELYSLPSRPQGPNANPPGLGNERPVTVHSTSTINSNLLKASSKSPEEEHFVTGTNEITSEKNTKYISTMKNGPTTPMSPTTYAQEDELIRVPTISYDTQSGNKKHDVLDHEENSINHILSMLNDSNPSPEPEPLPEPNSHPDPHDDDSGIQTWVSIDGTSVGPPEIKFPSVRPSARPDATTVTFPYTFYKPNQGSVYYDYEGTQHADNPDKADTHDTPMKIYTPISSTQGTYSTGSSTQDIYSNRPSTNPPAPTVIVLGPLGNEYVTKGDHKTPPRRPPTTAEPVASKKPAFSTTITHNINTVISTNNMESNNTRVVSSSYISVDLKDGATSTKPVVVNSETTVKPAETPQSVRPTVHQAVNSERPDSTVYYEIETKKPPISPVTLSTWSEKPAFHLKPSYTQPGAGPVAWPQETIIAHNPIIFKDPIFVNNEGIATPVSPEDETTAPDDFNNFPPVRNPNLNMSVPSSQQEKPTIVETFNQTFYPDFQNIDENDIPTPAFIDDDALGNKVDVFVNKIVESLQDNFDDMGDLVYKKKTNTTTQSPAQPTVTQKPPVTVTTKKPIRRPTVSSSTSPTKKPTPTKRPPTRLSTTTQKTVTVSTKPTRPLKVSTTKPKPATLSATTTKPPQTVSKRPKPVRKPTVPTISNTEVSSIETERPVVSSTEITASSHKPNYARDCGVRPLMKTGRIVGGKAAKFGEWPWQVLVREATWLGLFTKNKCGGVLITNKYVTTAAHCQPGFLASLVAVLGEFDITGEHETKHSVSRNVKRVIVHRNYDPATFENDLAILEMETPVVFDTHIVPICMPDDGADFTGRMATVTGWGRLKYNGGVPSVLQEVEVPIMENAVCQEMFQTTGHPKLIRESFLCAGYANGQKDSCEGDSGGPLMLQRSDGRWELAGTVSHGIKCAAPYLPGVYMRTTFFKPWLHSITGV
ncbi:serine protease filzig [Diprion similis]|uniref:serine protease filzig n=1 Tax=Diprion similis TaxID=362088 RepID=UPI001EF8D2F0|nr:serine protease filzig [Diprion similis]